VTVNISSVLNSLERLPTHRLFGSVCGVQGLLIEVAGIQNNLSISDRCNIHTRDGRKVVCEVVGFRESRALVMPFGALEGLGSDAVPKSPKRFPRFTPTRRGSAGSSTPLDVRSTMGGPWAAGLRPIRSKRRRRRPIPANGSAAKSIWAFGRLTPSRPAATASAWASLPGPGSESRRSYR